MAGVDLEAYVARSRAIDLSAFPWADVPRHPVPPEAIRTLRYMQDIESHTIIYLRELLATRAVDEPDVATFLACWLYEETFHGLALARFLEAAGHPVSERSRPRGQEPFLKRLEAFSVALLSRAWPDFCALHMTWGAINELTTLTGYRRLAKLAGHPVLSELLERIMLDESRHFFFYYRQAEERLRRPGAARVARAIVDRFWAPVGSGEQGRAELRFLAGYLFSGDEGLAAARKIDETIRRLPGFATVRLVEAWIDSYAGSRSRPTALPAAARVGNAATVASIPPSPPKSPTSPRWKEAGMATMTAEPYRTYKPRPFTRAERESTTVLFGGLHWRLERLLQAVLENSGYKARILPVATKEDLLTGREVADIGQCCPTSFTTGNLVNFLRSETKSLGAEEVNRRYVYLTAGSCGACRFGQYHQSYELALRNTGLEAFRMFLLAQDQMDQKAVMGDGLDFNLPITFGCLWAIFCADLVQDLEYQVRPFEIEAGQTDAVVRESMQYLFDVFTQRPRKDSWRAVTWHLTSPYFARALREVHRRFDAIEVDRLRPKPIVKITGEFYLQTVEGDPNYNIHRWLEAEGAEVYPAAVTVWMDYLLRLGLQRFEDYSGIERGARFKLGAGRAAQALYRWTFDRLRRAMGDLPHELPSQFELRRLAAPYFHSRLDGGEGDMLVGKALWAHQHKKAHMICELSPYSCMPNTMSIGAMAGVIGKYPDLLYAPLEIKGDAEVHALSRCQMILTEAKKRAQREFESALEATRLTLDEVRGYLEAHPTMRRATYRVPRHGVAAGTAANLVLHVAERMGRGQFRESLSHDGTARSSSPAGAPAVAS